MADDISFFQAYDEAWLPLANAAKCVALVQRLESSGALTALRDPLAEDRFAARAGLDEATAAAAALEVLHRFGIVEDGGPPYQLSPAWLALSGPAAFFSVPTLLAGQAATDGNLRALGQVDYWDLPAEDRLALARAISPDSYSDGLVAQHRARIEADPASQDLLGGGRFLELGCGVAGRLLLTLRAVPGLTAVGVELSPDLAAEAERRAAELGVDDRITIICRNAGDFVADERFDFGFWSQFFFPDEARGAALRVMLASLRPGGWFVAPLGYDPDSVEQDVRAAQEQALADVMLRSWGVPERSVDDLVAEIREAGFVDVEVIPRDIGPAVRARRPA